MQVRPPEAFSCTDDQNRFAAWKRWAGRFNRFAIAAQLGKQEGNVQVECFIYTAGEQIAKLYERHVVGKVKTEDLGYATVIEKITEFFRTELNATQSRYELFNMKQDGRALEDYMNALEEKAEEAEFCGNCSSSLVATIFLAGLDDEGAKRHLLDNGRAAASPSGALSLAKAFAASRRIGRLLSTDAAATVGAAERVQQTMVPGEVDAVGRRASQAPPNRDLPKKRTTQFFPPRPEQAARPKYQLARGGSARSVVSRRFCVRGCRWHPNGRCNAAKTTCFTCGQRGHFAAVCASRIDDLEPGSGEDDAGGTDLSLCAIRLDKLQYADEEEPTDQAWWQKMAVGNPPQSVRFKLDTGASITVVPYSIYCTLQNRPQLRLASRSVISYSNHRLDVRGTCELEVGPWGCQERHRIKLYVINTTAPPILGLSHCMLFNLVSRTGQKTRCNARSVNAVFDGAQQVISEFEDVFAKQPGLLKDSVQSIRLREPVPPPKIFPPRRMPMRYKGLVKAELDRLQRQDIIRPTKTPARYVLPIVVVRKADSSLRLCLDPRYINPHIQRFSFPMPKTEHLFASLEGAQYFTVVDAHNAFFHLPLDKPSSELCTFSTQWGNYQFQRLPFGLIDASERFCGAIHELFSDLPGVLNCVDDFLIFGSSRAEHDANLHAFLLRCRDTGLKLKREKLQLATQNVKFLGHIISDKGISIPGARAEAIAAIKRPTNSKEVRRFLGMINYVAKFISGCAARTAPLRALAGPSRKSFQWTADAERSFNDLKRAVANAPVLAHVKASEPLVISTDASSFGLGAVLLQNGRPVAYASASLTPTQCRYAQIEKEMLAVTFACEHFRYYILGSCVSIETDHRPLVTLAKKDIATLSPRLQKMLLKMMQYDFSIRYVPGKFMYVADTLSRSPTQESYDLADVDTSGTAVLCALNLSVDRETRIKNATVLDATLAKVTRYVATGWPRHKADIAPGAAHYWPFRDELYSENGLLYRGSRLVIPATERESVLNDLHSAHQGEVRMLRLARRSVYWPSITADIRALAQSCTQCGEYQKANQKEPVRPSPVPPHPWHTVAIDFLHVGQDTFLVGADPFTKDFVIKRMKVTTTEAVCKALSEWWLQHGIPMRIVSDNGPPFNSKEFATRVKQWGAVHLTNSPGHSAANGFIERMIQTLKSVILKTRRANNDIWTALLTLRTTPGEDGLSPAELSNGRVLRTNLPVKPERLIKQPSGTWILRRTTLEASSAAMKIGHDHRVKRLPPLSVGQRVWVRMGMRDWKRGKVTARIHDRAYRVQLPNGQTYRRNRLFLRPDRGIHEPPLYPAQPHPKATNQDNEGDPLVSVSIDPIKTPTRGEGSVQGKKTRCGRNVRPREIFDPSNYSNIA